MLFFIESNTSKKGWDPPPLSATTYASEVMSHPLVTLNPTDTVGNIVDALKSTTHNGFPVVDHQMSSSYDRRSFGKLRGLVLRHELIVLLQHKIFSELYGEWEGKVDMNLFRMAYPRKSVELFINRIIEYTKPVKSVTTG